MQKEFFVIVNVASKGGQGKRIWEKKVKQCLKEMEISYKAVFTEKQGHAADLVMEGIKEGYREVIALGGDGTVNEVANGILKQKIVPSKEVSFALIPCGTGNDWARTMQIPNDVEKAVALIKRGEKYVQDVGLATYHKGGEEQERYFVNVAGTGFDASVAERLENNKKFGIFSYLFELLRGLISYKNLPLQIEYGATKRKEMIFTVAVGVCQYFGGGMKITPNAIPNDGLFDVSLIKNISKMGVVSQLINLYDGSFLKHKDVEDFRTKKLSVSGDTPQNNQQFYLQLDGELLGHGPILLESVDDALTVYAGM